MSDHGLSGAPRRESRPMRIFFCPAIRATLGANFWFAGLSASHLSADAFLDELSSSARRAEGFLEQMGELGNRPY